MKILNGSYSNQEWCSVLTSADVDGEKWVTILTTNIIMSWIRKQDKALWYEHVGGGVPTVDIHNSLLMLIRLTF